MIHPVGTRTIVTNRCILRRIRAEDAAAMYESWAKYAEVCRYFPFDPAADEQSYRERVLRWVESYDSGLYFQWIIERKADYSLIGIINLGHVDEANALAETNYMLAPACWNQGIMTEVLCAVLQYAFDEVGFNRVQAEVFDGNAASARVLEKCGMRFEGVARQRYYKHGHFIDTAQYAILRTDRDVR